MATILYYIPKLRWCHRIHYGWEAQSEWMEYSVNKCHKRWIVAVAWSWMGVIMYRLTDNPFWPERKWP